MSFGGVPPGLRAAGKSPVQKAAAQRYLNRASGKMETAQQIHAYKAPHTAVPAGHRVSKTTHTVTRTTAPAPAPADWTKMNAAQLRAFAENLVNKDVASAKTPFQQRNTQLSSEQQGAEQRYGNVSANTQSILGGIKSGQEESAKTNANKAAELVQKGQQGVEGIYKGQNGYVPPQVQQEREREEAQAKSTGAAFQQGVQARNEAQGNYLQGVQAAAAQRGQERTGEIARGFGKERAGNTAKEAQIVAEAPAKTQELWLKLTGQKTALDEARQKLGLQVQKNEITATNDTTKNRIAAANANTKARQVAGTESYRHASLAEKERVDSANIEDKAKKLAAKSAPNAVNPATGKPFSGSEVSKAAQGVGAVFQAIQRGREQKLEYGQIREEVERGYVISPQTSVHEGKTSSKTTKPAKLTIPKVTDPVLIRAATQLWKYHHMDPQVKAQLAAKGLSFKSDTEAYEALTGQPYSPPQRSGTIGSRRR